MKLYNDFWQDVFYRYKGSKPRAPVPVAPVPTPKKLDEEVAQRDADKRRQRIMVAGRGGTVLTQGQPLTTANATLLGRSTA